MNKLISALILSSVLLTPAAFASPRSECIKTLKQELKADMTACKDKNGVDKKECRQDAVKKANAANKVCRAKPAK